MINNRSAGKHIYRPAEFSVNRDTVLEGDRSVGVKPVSPEKLNSEVFSPDGHNDFTLRTARALRETRSGRLAGF